ncbi:MAG: hypothetical protein IJ001_10535 [Oscillospiraceae bacterium]|nr:hypothetical protein [Oscillospiraceae bacterium]
MECQTCESCVHFRQHYVVDEQRCMAVNCGHCVYPGLKHRRAYAKACRHFEERREPLSLPDRRQVIEFLTTDMLQHILELELPYEVVEGK